MKRAMFLMLAVFIVTISVNGDIGKGNWTEEEINYFKTKEYKGDKIDYEFERKWIPPYVLTDLSEYEFMGYGSHEKDCISKLILIGKLDKNTEFRYLSLLRNEIYARNGYIFKNARLKAFFNQMPWYKPILGNVTLNAYERWNVRKIKKIEKEVRDIVSIKEPNPDTLPEKYVKKVIMEAKWGKGEGEFALAGESPQYGPEPMIVDKKGNIYIGDRGNGRIAKYNEKGELERYFKYYDYTDNAKGMAKWGVGAYKLAVRNDILYTDIYYYSKPGLLSFNVNTGEKIKKIYNLQKYYKELGNLTFYGVNTEYIIDETGKFKRTDVEKRNKFLHPTVQRIINKNYPLKHGKLYGISYIGSDSLKNNYYMISIGDYKCIYKFSENNKLLAYIKFAINNSNSVGYLTCIGAGGEIYLLKETGIFKCIDNRYEGIYKFIPGKIQLIKWELQK